MTGEFEADIRAHIERYRMAGHDVEIDGPQFVALEIELHVCVAPEHFRSDVERELPFVERLLDLVTGGEREQRVADGRRGIRLLARDVTDQPHQRGRVEPAAQVGAHGDVRAQLQPGRVYQQGEKLLGAILLVACAGTIPTPGDGGADASATFNAEPKGVHAKVKS